MSIEEPALSDDVILPHELLEIGEEIANFSIESQPDDSLFNKEPTIEILPVSETKVFAFWEDSFRQDSTNQDNHPHHLQINSSDHNSNESETFEFSVPQNSTCTYFDLWKSGMLVEAVLGKNYNGESLHQESEFNNKEFQGDSPNAISSNAIQLPIRQASELKFLEEYVPTHHEFGTTYFSTNENHAFAQSIDDETKNANVFTTLPTERTDKSPDFSSSLELSGIQPFLFELEGTIASIQFSGKLNCTQKLYFFGKELTKISSNEFIYFYPILQQDFDYVRNRLFSPVEPADQKNIDPIVHIEAILHFKDLENAELIADYLSDTDYPIQFIKPLSISVPPPLYLISGIHFNE